MPLKAAAMRDEDIKGAFESLDPSAEAQARMLAGILAAADALREASGEPGVPANVPQASLAEGAIPFTQGSPSAPLGPTSQGSPSAPQNLTSQASPLAPQGNLFGQGSPVAPLGPTGQGGSFAPGTPITPLPQKRVSPWKVVLPIAACLVLAVGIGVALFNAMPSLNSSASPLFSAAAPQDAAPAQEGASGSGTSDSAASTEGSDAQGRGESPAGQTGGSGGSGSGGTATPAEGEGDKAATAAGESSSAASSDGTASENSTSAEQPITGFYPASVDLNWMSAASEYPNIEVTSLGTATLVNPVDPGSCLADASLVGQALYRARAYNADRSFSIECTVFEYASAGQTYLAVQYHGELSYYLIGSFTG